MTLVALILDWALRIYFYFLIARLILDLAISMNPAFRPKGILLPIAEIVMTVTDPPLRFVRRFIKPVRMGAIALDFGWTLVVLAVIFLRGLVGTLA